MFAVELDGVSKEIFSKEELSDDLKRELILFANEVLRDEQRDGFTSEPVVAVDGKFKRSVADVKPFGKIEFFSVSSEISEQVVASFDEIEKRNPRGVKNAGDKHAGIKYRNHNFVYYNKKLVAQNRLELRRWLDFVTKKGFSRGDEIAFVNVVPYARKLERFGVTAGNQRFNTHRGKRSRKSPKTGNQVSVPNGVYAMSQRVIKRIMKGRAFVPPVKFEPFDIKIGNMRNTFANANNKSGIGRPYLYPIIKIFPLEGQGVIQ